VYIKSVFFVLCWNKRYDFSWERREKENISKKFDQALKSNKEENRDLLAKPRVRGVELIDRNDDPFEALPKWNDPSCRLMVDFLLQLVRIRDLTYLVVCWLMRAL